MQEQSSRRGPDRREGVELSRIGEYLHRTYEQSMARPSAVVRERIGSAEDANPR